jgi:NitT/TauT family transport system substrate-binding protein
MRSARVSRSALLSGSAALVLGAGRPARAQSAFPVLRIGSVTAIEGSLQPWFANELGLFAKAGLNVDLQGFNSGNAAAAAILGGALDIASTTPLTLASAYVRNVPFVTIAGGYLNTPRSPVVIVVVPKNSPVRGAKDLVGKTVGLNTLRTISELALDAWLAKHNVDIASVKAIELPFAQLVPALARGAIDAALPGEPIVSAGVRAGEIRVLDDPMAAIGRRYLASLWFTTTAFRRQNPDAVRRFAGVMYQTARWANTHNAESIPLVAKYTKFKLEDIAGMARADFAEQLRFSELQPTMDAALKFGFIPHAIRAEELVEGRG